MFLHNRSQRISRERRADLTLSSPCMKTSSQHTSVRKSNSIEDCDLGKTIYINFCTISVTSYFSNTFLIIKSTNKNLYVYNHNHPSLLQLIALCPINLCFITYSYLCYFRKFRRL